MPGRVMAGASASIEGSVQWGQARIYLGTCRSRLSVLGQIKLCRNALLHKRAEIKVLWI